MAKYLTRRSIRLVCTLIILGTALIGVASYTSRKKQTATTPKASLNPLGFANTSRSVNYVGDTVCSDCHSTIAANYSRSAMAHSWRVPSNAVSIENVSSNGEFIPAPDGYRYEVFSQGDRLLQRESRVDDSGVETHSQVREVAYVLGSGTKGRSYVTESNGHLTIMPVAWYSASTKWDLNPGYDLRNLRFARPVAPECIMCHNSYPTHVAGSESQYRQPMPQGIGCERCHGPGALHVSTQRGDVPIDTDDDWDRTIVNPAKLPVNLQQDVCLQCHLSTHGGAVFLSGTNPFDFRPGQPLAAFRADFELSHASNDEFSAISHGTRLAKSLCYTGSRGELTCVYCHDPHVPTRDVAPSFFNSRCLNCHTAESCRGRPAETAHFGENSTSAANDCITCHMPKRAPTDIQHTVATDHWIRRTLELTGAGDNSGATAVDEYTPLKDFFQVAETGDQGIAHLRYGIAKEKPAYVKVGIRLLREAIGRQPRSVRWNYWLGFALRVDGKLPEAREHFEQALADHSNASVLSEVEVVGLHLEMARVYMQLGQPRRALEVCDDLLAKMPECLASLQLSVRAQAELGDPASMLKRARKGVELEPTAHYLWGMLGLGQLAFERDPRQALISLKRALELDPLDATTCVLLSEVYEALDEADHAETSLIKASAIDPNSIPSRLALAKFYMRQGRVREAVPHLRQVLSASPGHYEALQLMRATTE